MGKEYYVTLNLCFDFLYKICPQNFSFYREFSGNALWRNGEGTTLQTDRSRVRFAMVSLEFFSDIIPPVALWPWDRLSL